ncbi:MAG TPA: 16S rRNA (uracil(1498)-N(3))-methyltransferase [Tepidimicrobium sp.]|nr:16S rRNA (uracil(1498)-N(3))-methyltransferase [Tepidimicrobium sp.]
MDRFFVDRKQIEGNRIDIVGQDVRHIRNVLRLRPGDSVEVVADNIVHICEIMEFDGNRIPLNILDSFRGRNEPPIDMILYQGIAKGNRMDMVMQKATEIGFTHIYPIITHRTVVRMKDRSREQRKVERWQSIVEEAAKQSKRDRLPRVHDIIGFQDMVNMLEGEANIIVPYEEEETYGIKGAIRSIGPGRVHVVIGPEGGFEGEEVERLKGIGGKSVTLGPRILRTETAGLVVGSIILYELGDLGVR